MTQFVTDIRSVHSSRNAPSARIVDDVRVRDVGATSARAE
jgi:hypothetical protein